jgi:hypothetical protein
MSSQWTKISETEWRRSDGAFVIQTGFRSWSRSYRASQSWETHRKDRYRTAEKAKEAVDRLPLSPVRRNV